VSRDLGTVTAGILSTVIALAACSSEDVATPAFEAYDSAGVEIIVSHSAAGFDGPWTLSEAALLRIGKGREEEPYVFRFITGATRLSDRSIALLEAPSWEIRRFDSKGTHLLSFGGRGEGPGEFRAIRGGIRRNGDTLLLLDSDGTVARFDPEGRLLEEISAMGLSLRDGEAGGEWTHLATDGALWGARYPRTSEYPKGRAYRLPFLVVHTDPEGDGYHVVGEYLRTVDHEPRMGYYPAFFTRVKPSLDPPGLLIGDNETFTIDLIDDSGQLVRRMRYPAGIRAADPEVVEVERTAWFAQYEVAVERGQLSDLPHYRRLIEGMPAPEVWPGFRDFLGDTEGFLWALEYGPRDMVPGAMRDPADHYEALVFHPNGYLLGTVEFPARFTPLEIGADYVLGVEVDDLGVYEMALFGLTRGSL
jgi:hypothetical protein